MRTTIGFYRLALALCLALGALAANAEVRQMPWEATPPPHLIEDRACIEVGFWNTSITTQLRADATPSQPGTTLNGESDVGLASGRVMPDFELTLLPGKRQLLRLNGFSSRRNGTAVLTQTVQFDGNTYLIGDTAKSTLNLDMIGLGYAYRLLKAPRYELDIGADIQIASIEANVYVPRRVARDSDSGVLPIPMLDVEGRWEVYKKWQLLGRYRWLGGSGDSGNVSGRLIDWRVGVAWQFSQHLGVGLLYRNFGIHVDSASGSHPGAFGLDHKGLELAFRASL
jgi:hypothetical protein